ncbi:MAG: hypothetical protein LBS04_05865, partial [Tannerellaceae bacterium]|nr:hypothetical protein [Tannerellaceae bacterium]
MAKMNLSFTFKNGDLCLCATVQGTPKRNYKKVSNLQSPNFDSWDVKQQQFIEPTQEAINNNRLLSEMKARYQLILDNCAVNSGKELFELYEKGIKVEAKRELTFGEYLKKIIADMKNGSSKNPSKTYQVYVTLLHKLEIEREIINVPLRAINDKHFVSFGEFILNNFNGVNYAALMKNFKATLSKARKKQLTENVLNYLYMEDAPTKQINMNKVVDGVSILTKKQYNKFLSLDLSVISSGGREREYYKELYRDFCIFLYETKSRPCDVIALHSDTITGNNIAYLPIKKKNYRDLTKAFVFTTLTPKAKDIV